MQILKLRSVDVPCSEETTQAFIDWRKAVEHMIKYLLTDPERKAWRIADPRLMQIVDLDHENVCWRYGQQAMKSCGTSATALYVAYCDNMDRTGRAATRLEWCCNGADPDTRVGFDERGVLIIVQRCVRTCFIPGAWNERDKSTWRNVRRRSGRNRSSRAEERERRREEKRGNAWSQEERIYYRVFRPALQEIRRQHINHDIDPDDDVHPRDWAGLKETLKEEGMISFARWQEIRNRATGGAP